MDDARFAEARKAYEAGDHRTAAREFLGAAGVGREGNGAAYHMAGNALMRLRRFGDALSAYQHALEDELYTKRGSVLVNQAAAQTALGDYAEAIRSYEAAVEDPTYATPHKALQGMAGALLEMGRVEEAASAYRRAALDPANPNPGAALVNLGLCFMALDRPADAVEAYQAALGFDSYAGRGKALANLGQAYSVLGKHAEAVRAFDKAINLHGHALSPAAASAYRESLLALEPTELARPAEPARVTRLVREGVDGSRTGEASPAVGEGSAGGEGWDTGALAALSEGTEASDAIVSTGPVDVAALGGPGAGVIDDDAEVLAFLNRTDDEMRVRDRELRRAERLERRGQADRWKPIIGVAATAVVLVALLAGLYYSGFGWPTQQQTARGLLSAQEDGRSVAGYWVAVPARDVTKEMAKIPPMKSFTIDSVARTSNASTASVTVVPSDGAAPLHYEISLQREGVGWKVTGIENDWSASGGSS